MSFIWPLGLGRWALPFSVWAVVMLLQQHWIVPRCVQQPGLCDPNTLASWDRWSIDQPRPWAKTIDDGLQMGVTLAAFSLPVVWQWQGGRLAWRAIARDWGLLLEVGLWNVAATEATQLLVQRPRPALFGNPAKPPERLSQYTSFYSGHTSYVGALSAASVLLARRRDATGRQQGLLAGLAILATLAAGVLRILQSKHFLLDVLAGGLAGALVAYWVLTRRRP